MSQITSINSGGGGGGDILTLTGNSGGPVGPTAGNINLIGDVNTFVDVVGNPGTSTLTISLANQLFAVAQTVNDVPVAVFIPAITINPGTALTASANFIGATDTYSASVSGVANVAIRRPLIGASEINKSVINYTRTNLAGFFPTVFFNVVANNLQFFVSGENGLTINWTILLTFLVA